MRGASAAATAGAVIAIAGIAAFACSDERDNSAAPSAGSAGATTGGATTTTGGRAANGANGGTSSVQGGVTSSAGGRAAGGTNPSGSGGSAITPSGGSPAGGRAPVAGGTTGSGGAPATGGRAASGTGGTSSAGENSGGAGSCVEATCGSHKWPCWPMPNPASSPATVPNKQSYTELGNGAVRDNITCLVWEKANPATQGTWQTAFDRCAALASDGYAGFDDWRLPTRVEMASITDVTLGSRGFPAAFTTTGGYYVTASFWYKTILTAAGANPEDRVWGYGTNGFTSNAIVRSNTNNLARCVRGNGPGEAADEYAVAPAEHYTLTGEGADAVVRDNYTGLVWQRTFSAQRLSFAETAEYCAGQTTGGLSGWRVPTLNELASTVNEALVAPAIDRTIFPDTNGACDETGWYWAAEASKVGGTGWGISYCDGYTGWNAGADASDWNYFTEAFVRCVK